MTKETSDKLRQLEEANKKLADNIKNDLTSVQPSDINSWWSTTDAMTISLAVLLFGLFVIFFATYLIKNGKKTSDVLRIFGTILIIIMAIFLVVAGYSDAQIAPVMGLLGTIAGYLLGKETDNTKS